MASSTSTTKHVISLFVAILQKSIRNTPLPPSHALYQSIALVDMRVSLPQIVCLSALSYLTLSRSAPSASSGLISRSSRFPQFRLLSGASLPGDLTSPPVAQSQLKVAFAGLLTRCPHYRRPFHRVHFPAAAPFSLQQTGLHSPFSTFQPFRTNSFRCASISDL
jgi:hypothetical protein